MAKNKQQGNLWLHAEQWSAGSGKQLLKTGALAEQWEQIQIGYTRHRQQYELNY